MFSRGGRQADRVRATTQRHTGERGRVSLHHATAQRQDTRTGKRRSLQYLKQKKGQEWVVKCWNSCWFCSKSATENVDSAKLDLEIVYRWIILIVQQLGIKRGQRKVQSTLTQIWLKSKARNIVSNQKNLTTWNLSSLSKAVDIKTYGRCIRSSTIEKNHDGSVGAHLQRQILHRSLRLAIELFVPQCGESLELHLALSHFLFDFSRGFCHFLRQSRVWSLTMSSLCRSPE